MTLDDHPFKRMPVPAVPGKVHGEVKPRSFLNHSEGFGIQEHAGTNIEGHLSRPSVHYFSDMVFIPELLHFSLMEPF